jgi:hypothetical protein
MMTVNLSAALEIHPRIAQKLEQFQNSSQNDRKQTFLALQLSVGIVRQRLADEEAHLLSRQAENTSSLSSLSSSALELIDKSNPAANRTALNKFARKSKQLTDCISTQLALHMALDEHFSIHAMKAEAFKVILRTVKKAERAFGVPR